MTTDAIARKLGNALVAPIVAFVPEGQHEPPTGHMQFAGTISLTGIRQVPDVRSASRAGVHDDYHYEALVAVADPAHIRAQQRIKAGRFSINGVNLETVDTVVANGRKLAEYRSKITADAIQKAVSASRSR